MDPCLLVRKNKYGTCFIGIYVDDNLMIGHLSAIDAANKDLKQHGLVLKVEDDFMIICYPVRLSSRKGERRHG